MGRSSAPEAEVDESTFFALTRDVVEVTGGTVSVSEADESDDKRLLFLEGPSSVPSCCSEVLLDEELTESLPKPDSGTVA